MVLLSDLGQAPAPPCAPVSVSVKGEGEPAHLSAPPTSSQDTRRVVSAPSGDAWGTDPSSTLSGPIMVTEHAAQCVCLSVLSPHVKAAQRFWGRGGKRQPRLNSGHVGGRAELHLLCGGAEKSVETGT